MASFSPTEAAFTGFRVVREHPKAVVGWVLLELVISLASSSILVGMAGPAVARFQAGGMTLNPDPAQALTIVRQLGPAYAVLALMGLAIYPVIYAAMNRAVLRPADDRFSYLRLGMDELRQLGLVALWLAVAIGAYVALILLGLVVALLGEGLGAVAGKAAGTSIAMMLLALALGAAIVGAIYAIVRLSLSSALTFATGRINLFGSWRLTRGQFWPMLGVLALAAAISVVVALLGMVVVAALVAAFAGGAAAFERVAQPDMTSLGAYFTPARLVYLGLMSILQGLMLPLMLTPPASIYQRLAGAHGLPGGAAGSLEDVFV